MQPPMKISKLGVNPPHSDPVPENTTLNHSKSAMGADVRKKQQQKKKKKHKPIKSEIVEQLCLEWYQTKTTSNLPVTRNMIMDQANRFALEREVITFEGSHAWLNSFIQRNKLQIAKLDASGTDSNQDDKTPINTPLYQTVTQPSVGTLMYQGAEARLYACEMFYDATNPRQCIVKERFVKSYRHPILDKSLSLQRLRAEVRQLIHCRKLGMDVPAVLQVDLASRRLWLSRIGPEAVTLNEWFKKVAQQIHSKVHSSAGDSGPDREAINVAGSRLHYLTLALGKMLARLHANHVVHGDLTMANILVRKATVEEEVGSACPRLALIDFGLSSIVSHSSLQRLPEEKAVDLYVFERALVNAIDHDLLSLISQQFPQFTSPEQFMTCVMESYRDTYESQATPLRRSEGKMSVTVEQQSTKEQLTAEVEANLAKLEEVRLRGRKRLMVG